MKTLTSMIVAAALITPAAVAANSGNRINTPGTENRHEANLAGARTDTATQLGTQAAPQARASEQSETERTTKRRPRAALAGKVNVAARSRNQ